MSALVYGHDDTCLAWLYQRWGGDIGRVPQLVIGITDAGGVLHGAIPLWQENAWTWEMGLYSEGVVSPRITREFFAVAFWNLGAHRLQMKTEKSNKRMCRLAPKLGWTYEGTAKDYYGTGQHAVCFGMTPHTCRWIKRHEIIQAAQV